MNLQITCLALGCIITMTLGCSSPSNPVPTAAPTPAARPLSNDRVQTAVNQMTAPVRTGTGTIAVQGIRQTADGGAEADLVFNDFHYNIPNGGRTYAPWTGNGIGTIAHYADGLFLTKVTWEYGVYVTGKIPVN